MADQTSIETLSIAAPAHPALCEGPSPPPAPCEGPSPPPAPCEGPSPPQPCVRAPEAVLTYFKTDKVTRLSPALIPLETQTLAGPPDVGAACLGLEEHLNCQCLGEKGGGRQVVNMVWVHTSTSSTSASAATSISHSPHPVGSRRVLRHGATPPTPLLCRRGAGTSKVAAGLSSPTLMDRAIPDFSSCNSVDEWLDTIKMSRYKDHFAAGGYHTLGHILSMNQGDIQRLGVTLMGHQKKIMTSVQVMRVQVLNRSVPSVHV
ncbi:unnamed protein product [Arctogadus glacialis]